MISNSLILSNFHLTSSQVLRYSLVIMSPAFRSGPYFIYLVRLPVLSILIPSPDFTNISPGLDFIKLVPVQILSILSPGPDFIQAVRKTGSGPGSISFLVRVLILFIESGSGPDFIFFLVRTGSEFYQACKGPGPRPRWFFYHDMICSAPMGFHCITAEIKMRSWCRQCLTQRRGWCVCVGGGGWRGLMFLNWVIMKNA